MKIPKEVKIGTRTIAIYVAPMEGLFGQYSPLDQSIVLNASNTPSQMQETFWHELIHAINDYNRVYTTLAMEIEATQFDGGSPDVRAYNFEERMTEDFARVFLQVVQDNDLLPLAK